MVPPAAGVDVSSFVIGFRIESHPKTTPPRHSNHHPPFDTIVIHEIASSSLSMEPPVPVPGRTIRSAGRHGYGDIII